MNVAGGAGGNAAVDVNHLTILGNGDPSSFGLASTSVGGGSSTITLNAQNTIVGGVAVSASRTAMGGMNVANLGISYSDFDPATAVGSPAQGPGNINADPQLALSGGEIFEPQATSPVVNAGAPGDLVPGAESLTDVDFNPRISGGRRDMGAVEFQFGFLPPPDSVLPAPGPAAQPVRDDPPILEDLTVKPNAFAVARSSTPVAARGTRISYRLNEPANVALQIQRAAPGRRSGRRCVRPTRRLRRARRCTRYRRVGALRRNSTAGKTNVRFTGRIGRRALRPGKHRVVALAVDTGNNRSESANARFRVVRASGRR